MSKTGATVFAKHAKRDHHYKDDSDDEAEPRRETSSRYSHTRRSHASENRPSSTAAPMDLVVQEVRRTGLQVQRECSEVFKDVSMSLREDLRREMQKIASRQTLQSHSFDAPVAPAPNGTQKEPFPVSKFETFPVSKFEKEAAMPKSMTPSGLWNAVSDGGAWVDSVPPKPASVLDIPKPIGLLDPPTDLPPFLPCEVPTTTLATKKNYLKPVTAFECSLSTLNCPTLPADLPSDRSSNERPDPTKSVITRSYTGAMKDFSDEDKKAVKINRNRISIGREKARVEKNKRSSVKAFSKLRTMSVAELIKTTSFDNFVGGIIMLNAVIIGIQTEYNAHHVSDEVPVSFFIFEQAFAIWFTVELSLRIYVMRCSFFIPCVEGWMWNYFDTLVVSAQLVEIFFEFVARSTSVDASNFRVLRVLRILRLVRILRVVRVLHLISELRAIMSSIMGSFRSLVWVVVLLLLMLYIVAVFFTQSVVDHRITMREDDITATPGEEEKNEALAYYFGSMGRSILSLWQAMSGGLDWDTLAGPLFDNLNFITGTAFACFIAFGVLALMNVVTGVFVQTALLSAKEEEDTFMRSQVIALFHIADKEDKAAIITYEEILESIEDPKQAKEWKSIGVQAEDARDLFKLLDVDGEEQVSFEEFMGGCLRLNGPAKAFDLLTVMQEQRKNEEHRKVWTMHVDAVLEELLTGERLAQDDVESLLRTSATMSKQVSSCSDDVAVLLTSLAAEMNELKQMLRPIRVMEQILHADGNNNYGGARRDDPQNHCSLV